MRICGIDGVRGCIFDFNGTLLFDTPAHADAWRAFLLEEGVAVTDADIQKIAATYQAFAVGTLEDVKGFCAVATTV